MKRFYMIDHFNIFKPNIKSTKKDLEITEEKLKQLVNKFNVKNK